MYPLAEFKVSDPDPEIIPPIALDVDVELIITPDKPVTAARLTAPVPAVIVRPDVLPKLNATIPEPPEPPNALVPPPAPPPPPPLYKRQKSVFFSLPKKISAPNKADFGVAKLNAPYFSEYLSRAILSPRYRPMPPFLARRWGGSWPKIALIGS